MSQKENQKPLSYLLKCPIMNYPWGKRGETAFIPKLLQIPISQEPTAELWMGSHPKGSGKIQKSDQLQSIYDLFQIDPGHYLGREAIQKGYSHLSFLFKILDVEKPLSIQAHPNSSLAKKLHKKKPKHYPDSNEKPELAVCVEGMRALVGFLPFSDFLFHMERHNPLAELCSFSKYFHTVPSSLRKGESVLSNIKLQKKLLKAIYSELMQSNLNKIERAANSLLRELEKKSLRARIYKEDELFQVLTENHGTRDPGIFCAYFFNYMILASGEALFLEANVPHSYISGTIIECMAPSDNVVRGGLTSKYCDIPTLVEMLDYTPKKPILLKAKYKKNVGIYSPPISNFCLLVYSKGKEASSPSINANISSDVDLFDLDYINLPSILIAFEITEKAELYFYKKGKNKVWTIQNIRQGAVILLPGDLEERGFQVKLHLKQAKIYRSVGPVS